MISFDFEYYKPDTLDEAVEAYSRLNLSELKPVYYAGGTDIISLARCNQMEFKAVIDIKDIPECRILKAENNQIKIGAAVSLTQICEFNPLPLLTAVLKMVADHTSRNRITFGGNVCSLLPYKEAVLPLLICNADVVIMGPEGCRTTPINQIFKKKMVHDKGEFLVQFIIADEYGDLPYRYIKKTRSGELDYPLISVAALKKDNQDRFAFSGIYPYPFRSAFIEEDLNNADLTVDNKIDLALSHMRAQKVDDILGSAEYREFLISNALRDIMFSLEEVQ